MYRKQWQRALIIVSLIHCTGCVSILAAGAATVGTVVILKSQTVTAMERDHRINHTLNQYWKTHKPPHSQLVIQTYHGIVLLVGRVKSTAIKESVVEFAHTLPGVRRVYNEITSSPPLTLKQDTKDIWITTKIKSHFLAEKNINSMEIKVTTYNGIVYLMGIVTPYEARQASNKVRTVQGVKRVVTLFQYRPEE